MFCYAKRFFGPFVLMSMACACATTGASEEGKGPAQAVQEATATVQTETAVATEAVDAEEPGQVAVRLPFVMLATLPETDVVTTSVHRVKDGLTLNTPQGGSVVLEYADPQHVRVFPLSEKAQVGCTFENKVALIERDATRADYALVVYSSESAGALEKLGANPRWDVKTRGFIPNPGSGCAFVSAQKLVVEGTRLRDNRAPYHGIFTLTPRRLDFWTLPDDHIPHVMEALPEVNGEAKSARVVLGSAPTPKGSGVSSEGVYTLNEETSTGNMMYAAEYLKLVGRYDEVLAVTKSGACLGMVSLSAPEEAAVNATNCLFEGATVLGLNWVSDDDFEVQLDTGRKYLVTDAMRGAKTIELPSEIVVLSRVAGSDDLFVVGRRKNDKQNVATLTGIGRLERE